MDPTEESFMVQVRETSVAQVTHVKPKRRLQFDGYTAEIMNNYANRYGSFE